MPCWPSGEVEIVMFRFIFFSSLTRNGRARIACGFEQCIVLGCIHNEKITLGCSVDHHDLQVCGSHHRVLFQLGTQRVDQFIRVYRRLHVIVTLSPGLICALRWVSPRGGLLDFFQHRIALFQQRCNHIRVKAQVIRERVQHKTCHMVVTVQHPGVIIKAQQHNLTSGLILPLIQFFCIGECGKERLSIARFQQRKGHLGVFWQLDSSIFVRFRRLNFNLSRCKEYTAHHQVDNRVNLADCFPHAGPAAAFFSAALSIFGGLGAAGLHSVPGSYSFPVRS